MKVLTALFAEYSYSKIKNEGKVTKEIVFHVRKTFLFYKGQPYKKTNTPSFDVPMGAYDSAEVCDLVGLYLLTLIRHLPVVSGIYRDDALCLSNLSPSDTDDIKKQIQRIYSEQGLKIEINVNKHKLGPYLGSVIRCVVVKIQSLTAIFLFSGGQESSTRFRLQ